MDLLEILKRHGYNQEIDKYRSYINEWDKWYKGKEDSFHNYTIPNGETTIHCERARLNMAKRGCEHWADLLWNSESYVVSKDYQKEIDEILINNNFLKRFNQSIEESFALGTGAAIIFEVDGQPKIDFVKADYIYPLKILNGEIINCAFISYYNEQIPGIVLGDGESILQVMVHSKVGSNWEITNEFYKTDQSSQKMQAITNPRVKDHYVTNAKRYAIITPNIKNNISQTPFGISVFGNCIDTLKNIDLAYDGIQVSMQIGRPRIAVDGSTLKIKNGNSEPRPIFDPNDIAFYVLGSDIDSGVNDKRLIQDITTPYRAAEFEQSLQAQLMTYSQAIGLGESFFRWDKGSMVTAREVLSRDSAMTRSMRKHQDGLKGSIIDICKALLDVVGKSTDTLIEIHFDDSITRNKEAEEQKAWQWVVGGYYPFWKYLIEYEGYSEEEAKSLQMQSKETFGDEL